MIKLARTEIIWQMRIVSPERCKLTPLLPELSSLMLLQPVIVALYTGLS